MAEGHVVWAVSDDGVVGGTAKKIDNDGHCTLLRDSGGAFTSVHRQNLCLKWQVGAHSGVTAPAARVVGATATPDTG